VRIVQVPRTRSFCCAPAVVGLLLGLFQLGVKRSRVSDVRSIRWHL
jgi:hypothetical protein